MSLQNRVMPSGDIVTDPARGIFTGNRGILHRDDKTLGLARWTHKAWICCSLDWQGRKRAVMTGRNWTELFFLDETVALAAGHRPCGYCRREAYAKFVACWAKGVSTLVKAPQIDAALHTARVTRTRQQVTHVAPLASLPDGSFILWQDKPHLVQHRQLYRFSPSGYGAARALPHAKEVTVMTPAPIVAVLTAGYTPRVHHSASAQNDSPQILDLCASTA